MEVAMSRYSVSHSEGKYASGSDDLVLENKLGITRAEEMDGAELVLLEQLYHTVFEERFPSGKISFSRIKHWHRIWLGNIYEWAGQIRTVNISKQGFMFAPAAQLQKLISSFEKNFLATYTPCQGMDIDHLAKAIAVVHVELILIHPFREGNGRLARLLADVMAVQGGRRPLNYQSWEHNKARYTAAIHAGMVMNYNPMMQWVMKALED